MSAGAGGWSPGAELASAAAGVPAVSGMSTAGAGVPSVATVLAFAAGALGAVGAALVIRPRRVASRDSPRRRPRALRGARLLRAFAAAGARLPPGPAAAPADLAARIAAAGHPAGLGPRELMAAKVAAGLAAGVAGTMLGTSTPGRLGPLVVVAAPLAGFLAPDLWLARLAADRARRVRRELPMLLDLLRVTVEAGTSLPEALRQVGERADGPLAAEWQAVGRQVALGVPLATALPGMVESVPLPEVRALVAALDRARRHGAPLAETLAAQARDSRFALARRVREDAARAGPKMQLVVALLLVPSVLLLVAAALASALLGRDGEVVPV
ncbi:MAG: type II secretion system F family protein [Thermoleophilaceae bacterium]|nr:type II secretion system F family protein [Thermoleophilaceae bacterium]